jgi:hypothetical protein
VVHVVELLVLHLELNLLLLVLKVATRWIEGLLNVPNEIILFFLLLSVRVGWHQAIIWVLLRGCAHEETALDLRSRDLVDLIFPAQEI